MFIEVDKGEASTVKMCSMMMPGHGSCNARSWWSLLKSMTLMGCGCTAAERGEGWMVFFFCREGEGRGWRKDPVADVENAIIFFVEMKKCSLE